MIIRINNLNQEKIPVSPVQAIIPEKKIIGSKDELISELLAQLAAETEQMKNLQQERVEETKIAKQSLKITTNN